MKAALSVLGVLVLIAAADVTGLVLSLRGEDSMMTPEEASALRDGLLATEDSLNEARATLAAHAEFTRDSIASSGAGTESGRAAFLERRRRELALTRTPSRRATPVPAESRSIIAGLPVIGAIASRFSMSRKHPVLGFNRPHLGVDVAARYGTSITAPASGRVTFVGHKLAYGLVVEMEHPGGITTRYAHCSRRGQARHADRDGRVQRVDDRAAPPLRGESERAQRGSDAIQDAKRQRGLKATVLNDRTLNGTQPRKIPGTLFGLINELRQLKTP